MVEDVLRAGQIALIGRDAQATAVATGRSVDDGTVGP